MERETTNLESNAVNGCETIDQAKYSSSSASSSSSSDSLLEPNIIEKDDFTLSISQVSSQVPSSNGSPQPIQTLGRPTGYDPNRIPSSVFGSKPTNPTEWSVASNESLFSIHMGNNSFSRDHIFFLDKSGELTRYAELMNMSPSLPPVNELENIEKRDDKIWEDLMKTGDENTKVVLKENEDCKKDETMVLKEMEEYHSEGKLKKGDSASDSDCSEGSNTSTRSFAFPVLEGEDGRSVLMKVESEKQKSERVTSNPAQIKWFSCFSCCPHCC